MTFVRDVANRVNRLITRVNNSKKKITLELKEKVLITQDVYDFLFAPNQKLTFKPGQYLELILNNGEKAVKNTRRCFSIASSPAEAYIRIGVKFYPHASGFKQSMLKLKPGDKIIASRLAGDFVLPKSKDKKLVFIAGGIGITPFRSMIKHLLDINEKRDIILLYSNFKPADIVYKDIFDQSEKQLGIKTIYTVTDKPCPKDWVGENCFIDEDLIQKTVMDYRERTFYLSGSHNMAAAMDKILRKMGIPKQQIKKDFFLGLA